MGWSARKECVAGETIAVAQRQVYLHLVVSYVLVVLACKCTPESQVTQIGAIGTSRSVQLSDNQSASLKKCTWCFASVIGLEANLFVSFMMKLNTWVAPIVYSARLAGVCLPPAVALDIAFIHRELRSWGWGVFGKGSPCASLFTRLRWKLVGCSDIASKHPLIESPRITWLLLLSTTRSRSPGTGRWPLYMITVSECTMRACFGQTELWQKKCSSQGRSASSVSPLVLKPASIDTYIKLHTRRACIDVGLNLWIVMACSGLASNWWLLRARILSTTRQEMLPDQELACSIQCSMLSLHFLGCEACALWSCGNGKERYQKGSVGDVHPSQSS